METKYLKYILVIWALGITLSCEDMLDTEIKSSITGQNYWKTENDFVPYLFSIYQRNRSMMADNMIRIGEERGEMWEEGYNNRFQFWDQNLTPGTTYDWTAFYGTIGHCNLLLEQIENFDFSNQTLKNRVKAETLALRANTYFFLARVWGDVPIVLNSVEDENAPLYPRSPVAEVFNQINTDIGTALELFPENGYQDKYRFSKPAVYALQADVKMWTGKVLGGGNTDFDAAIKAIQQVEASGVVLLDDYGSIFDTDKNEEIILSIYCDRYEYTSPRINEAFLRFDTSNGADNIDELPIRLAAQQAYAVAPRLLELFEEYPTDKRIERTYIPELYEGVPRKYWANKYRGTQYSDDRTPDSDIIVYRLSGLLLLKAEAYLAMDNLEDARIELNRVRTRAGLPDVTETDKTLLAMEILDERGRELFHEGKRWLDLRRAHSSGLINVYEFVPNLLGKSTPLYWPVHTNVLIKNELLTDPEYQ
ncbi:SusD family protein [Kriegella aquimaris]|uniref:SusD family protein n=2 Tax=Kriegella aquimaris TaxID=192904 RepID=A0A1G9VCR5_9FLAO|nr:SusD family protein [Kriegella aquimaris]